MIVSGWQKVEDYYSLHQVDGNSIELITRSKIGSKDRIDFYIFAKDYTLSTREQLSVYFSNWQMRLFCITLSGSENLVNVPNGVDKIWNFTFTNTTISIECNGVVVLHKLYRNIYTNGTLHSFCGDESILPKSGEISHFQFTYKDTASQLFRREGGIYSSRKF